MGDVQPAAGRTGDASGLRLLLLVLLLLIHDGDIFFAGGTDGEQKADRSDQWMHVKCKTDFGRMCMQAVVGGRCVVSAVWRLG